VLIGEMRDLETIESALRIAETGHLTLATLHTNSAPRPSTASSTSSRPTSRASPGPAVAGAGGDPVPVAACRAPTARAGAAMEILIPNSAIRNLIREDKVHRSTRPCRWARQVRDADLQQSLATLYFKKLITLDLALSMSSNPTSSRR